MKGRNEHTLKNHFKSILRYVNGNGISVGPNDFQDILDKFKVLKGLSSLKTQKNFNCMLQMPNELEEIDFSPKKLALFDETAPIYSPNLTEIMEPSSPQKSPREKAFVFNFKAEETKPIFTANYFSLNGNYRRNNDSFDIESISQKISSLSLVDKMILEANNVSNISANSKFTNMFWSSKQKSNFLESNNSSSNDKSVLCSKVDPILLGYNEDYAKSTFYFSNAPQQNVMYDFEWDNPNTERCAKSRCKTQKMNANEIQERMYNPTANLLRKKKSMTFTELSFNSENYPNT